MEEKKLSLDDIKKLPVHSITATLMGAAHRRDELSDASPLPFIPFSGGCCGTAVFKGARLKDVLMEADMKIGEESSHHVVFEGLDTGPAGSHYAASILIKKAMSDHEDVLLVYEMNGKPLTPDHG